MLTSYVPLFCPYLQALWYCFDVSLLQREDSEEALSSLCVLSDSTYIQDIHQEMTSTQAWAVPGLKASAQLSWAVMLRQISQFNVGNGGQCVCFCKTRISEKREMIGIFRKVF